MLAIAAGFAAALLLFVTGRRTLGSAAYGVLTALLFLLTPLLWLQATAAPATLLPLPFVAGWLLALTYLEERSGLWWAAIGGALLGAGLYTSLAAAVMMPLYLALTLMTFLLARTVSPARLAACVGGFLLVSAPFLLSIARRPDDFRHLAVTHHLYDAYRFNVLQGVREMTSWVGMTARSEMYYDYFSPSFLFLTGRVLLFPGLVLLPAGMYRILLRESTPFAMLSLAGFLTAPFAAALTAERPTPGRIVVISIFAAIVSAYGVRELAGLRRDRG